MNIDIRKYIKNNFKDIKKEGIKDSITSSINEKEDITLPGLGVFFEILWSSSNDDLQNKILDILYKNLTT